MTARTEVWPAGNVWRYRVTDEFGEAARGERPTREQAEAAAHFVATGCRCGSPEKHVRAK